MKLTLARCILVALALLLFVAGAVAVCRKESVRRQDDRQAAAAGWTCDGVERHAL